MSRFFKGGSNDSDAESVDSSEGNRIVASKTKAEESSSSEEESSEEESSSSSASESSESESESESESSESEDQKAPAKKPSVSKKPVSSSEESASESESESESDSETSDESEESESDSEDDSEVSESESDSENESESESESQSESEAESESETSELAGPSSFLKKPEEAKPAASRFLRGESSEESSDEEEGRRVVKSAKDKRLDEFYACIDNMKDAMSGNKWIVVSNEFDHLNKVAQKSSEAGRRPPAYIEFLSNLDQRVESADKAFIKSLDAANGRALNALKQRVRKISRQFTSEIERFRKDPEAFMKPTAEVADVPKAAGKAGQDEIIVGGVATRGIVAPSTGEPKTEEISPSDIFKHLRAIFEARGKKSTDRAEQIRFLEKLSSIAVTDYQRLRVKVALLAARFDVNTGSGQYMPLEQWNGALKELHSILDILDANRKIVIVEQVEDEFEDEEEAVAASANNNGVVQVQGSVVSFLERLDDEFTRSLQMIDPHAPEYIERLKDETALYTLLVRSQAYLERIGVVENTSRLIMRRLERVYYKPEQVIRANEEAALHSLPSEFDLVVTPRATTDTPDKLINALCVYLYNHGISLLRTCAMLCHIYHEALQNRFYKSRDMLLMSHLQDSIHAADIATQILHNRTMVQIGLCAFRNGMIQEAQYALQDISTTGRIKELLGQGIQAARFGQFNPDQERLDKQLVLPFHMHINLELLECVYLTCSMFMEIPVMAAASSSASDARKRVISRPFRRMLEYTDRQLFIGPPENTREFIMQASKALAEGEWRKSEELIHAIKIWNLMPDTEKIKSILSDKIREEGLRTYLLSYAAFYDSVSLDSLAETSDLPLQRVTVIVSRLLSKREIHAALDQVHRAVIFERVEINKLENMAISLSEKTSQLHEANEKLFEQKTQHTNPQDNRRREKTGSVKRRNDRSDNRGRQDMN
ncbi:translation initiation factor eIF3c [Schizosaccharomyces octosporus yFS286]|uniref:Eukaryotic translation initiation factor 3 subunit C n=1 Tax=Schizosaccharomyces octosporus (strain yFS286) TaxID=483514 RepID=S9PYH2_SCHOY|nr:translation initiation factor eIF3c [Schizosaccharomyces octosporus yFS286]EPX73007.1 translation initiation factor eIF3c [Schizosaccharomyces octosporus yFS286]